MTTLNELTGTYTIDPTHSRIGFVTRHAMVTKVRGSFDAAEGTAVVPTEGIDAATISVTVQTSSFDTRNEQRDQHVKAADFLDVENHPTITFLSTSVTANGDVLDVTGDLTIKGVSKQVSIPFEFQGAAKDPFGNERVGFEGSATINRNDFGLTWNAALETGGVLVSEKVQLEIEISAIKTA